MTNLNLNLHFASLPLRSAADIRRDNRPELKKAGNLRNAFAQTSGDMIAIFDADFCPRADFLRETLPYFVDPEIGILQTPQFFRRREEQTWVEQGAGASQEVFYRMIQVGYIDGRFGKRFWHRAWGYRRNRCYCIDGAPVAVRMTTQPYSIPLKLTHRRSAGL